MYVRTWLPRRSRKSSRPRILPGSLRSTLTLEFTKWGRRTPPELGMKEVITGVTIGNDIHIHTYLDPGAAIDAERRQVSIGESLHALGGAAAGAIKISR